MALRIRLQRHGAKNAPAYRMVVAESTARRDGRFVEVLGDFQPQARGQQQESRIKLDRVDYWLSVGALPSDTAGDLIRRARQQQAAVPAAS